MGLMMVCLLLIMLAVINPAMFFYIVSIFFGALAVFVVLAIMFIIGIMYIPIESIFTDNSSE